MGRRTRIAWIAGFLSLLAAAQSARAGEPEKPLSPWRDPAVIERRFSEACDAVETVVGAKFAKRPTVRISTSDEMKKILERELRPVYAAMGMAESMPAGVAFYSEAMVAKYEPETHVVHVLPANAERLAKVLGNAAPDEDALRVVLAHEVTHALDFSRHPLVKMQGERTTLDGQKGLDAVVEGHAQWVAEQIAAKWGLQAAFARFTASITALPPVADESVRRIAEALAAVVGFSYVQGHAFVKAVATAQGSAGVERLLDSPPQDTFVVEHPERYLTSTPASAPDLEGVLDAMRPLIGDPAWKVTATRMLEAMLRTQAEGVPVEHRKDFLRGYEDGRLLVAQVAEEGAQVVLLALAFDTSAHADAFLAAEKAGAKVKSQGTTSAVGPVKYTFSEGAGREGTLAGYAVHAVVKPGDEDLVVDSLATAFGRVVVEMMVVGALGLDRAAQDEALERARLRAADPTARPAPAARVPAFLRKARAVTLRVLDPDGKTVARASVAIVQGRHESSAKVADGRASLSLRREPANVTVSEAADADGRPLPLAPKTARVAADATELEVRLERGVAIEGVVVDEAGKPVAGASVVAIETRSMPADFASSFHPVRGKATSGADGAFRIVGLEPRPYFLRATADSPSSVSPVLEARGGDPGVRLVLVPTLEAAFRVVDGKDSPVGGAQVTIGRLGTAGTRATVFEGISGPEGSVLAKGLEAGGRFDLEVRPPSWREDLGGLSRSDWRPGQESRVALAEGFTITGVVKDTKGAPVRAHVLRRTRWSWEGVDTKADGTFRIPSLAKEPVALAAVESSEDPPPSERGADVWTLATPEKPAVELVLRKQAPVTPDPDLRVRVIDPEGRPVVRGRVRLAHVGGSVSTDVREGWATLKETGGGRLRVFACRDEAGRPRWGPAETDVAADDTEVEVRLTPGRRLSGRVVDDGGVGVAGARVRATGADVDDFAAKNDEDAEATTAADGGFVLEGLGDEGVRVRVDDAPAPLLSGVEHFPVGAQDVKVVLQRGSVVSLTVLDWNGRPVRGAAVSTFIREQIGPALWRLHDDRMVESGADGKVRELRVDPTDAFQVSVQAPPDRDDLLDAPDAPLPAGGPLVLGHAYRVTGIVRDGAGRPVGTLPKGVPDRREILVRVWPNGAPEYRAKEYRSERIVDVDGRFSLRVPYGPARIAATASLEEDDLKIVWADVSPENPTAELRLPTREPK